MGKSRWSWKKKIVAGIFLVILAGGIRFGMHALRGWRMAREVLTPRVYAFSSAAELGEQKGRWEALLNVEIPEFANEIYICREGGRDLSLFTRLSFTTPEGAGKFATEFTQVSISKFCEGKASKISFINEGPSISRKKHEIPHWWDLGNVNRSIYYEIIKEDRDKDGRIWSGHGRFIVVDLDTNRVYLCVWHS